MKMNLGIFLFAATLSLGTQCRKNKGDRPLPPLTTTGERTFGCLINGNVFLPRKEGLNASQQCVYQRMYSGDRAYVFLVKGNHEDGCSTRSVSIYLDSIKLAANTTYELTVEGAASNYGRYFIGDCNNIDWFYTDNENRGQLTITFLDEEKNIVAGTFWFNVTTPYGTKYAITDGRFDQEFNR